MWQNGGWQAPPEVGGYTASCVGSFRFAGCMRPRLTLSTPSNLEDYPGTFPKDFPQVSRLAPMGPRDSALDGAGT